MSKHLGDEYDKRVLALHAEGLSRAQIAKRMGTTRNAICGKLHRLLGRTRPHPIKRPSPVDAPMIKRSPMLCLPAPPKLLALPPPSRPSTIEIGAHVVWTDAGRYKLRERHRDVGPGIITHIHYWKDAPPSITIKFPRRVDVAYIYDVELVR